MFLHHFVRSTTGRITAAFILLASIALAWANALNGAFVFDDLGIIVTNPLIKTWWADPASIGSTITSVLQCAIMRPVGVFTFRLSYALGGLEPFGYHAFNIIIHMINSLLAWAVVRRALQSPALYRQFGPYGELLAWLIAAVWALHPVQTESVTYMVQRFESLMALFYLATIYCWSKAVDRASLLWCLLSIACCALGMATKEVMITAPLVVFLYDGLFLSTSWQRPLQRRLLYVALVLPVAWVLYQKFFHLDVILSQFPPKQAGEFLPYVSTQPLAILHYLRLIVWPYPLIFDYGWTAAESWLEIAPAAAGVIAIAALAAYGLVRRQAYGFAFACYLIILSPTSSFIPLMNDFVVEHRIYLPSLPIIALLVSGAFWLLRPYLPRATRPAPDAVFIGLAAALATLIISLGVLTHQRNKVYAGPIPLWSDTVAKAPNNSRAHYNLGYALNLVGRNEEAEEYARRALLISPSFVQAHDLLGAVLTKRGADEEAEAEYMEALRLDPQSAITLFRLGILYKKTGYLEAAEEKYRAALAITPDMPQVLVNLASVLLARDDIDGAEAALRQALSYDPTDGYAHYNLANILFERQDYAAALAEYRAGATAMPTDPEFHTGAARALIALEDTDGAKASVAAALAIDPQNPSALELQGMLGEQ